MSEEPAPRPDDSERMHSLSLTPGSLPGDAEAASRRIPKQLSAALAQTIADALDAAGAAAIRQEPGIPANASLSDRQVIDQLWAINNPAERARCARLATIGYLRALARLGLISGRLSDYAVFGLEALNAGGAEGFAKPTPQSKRTRRAAHRDDQLSLYVASAVAYLRARHRASISMTIGWLRGDASCPPGTAWQPRTTGFLPEARTCFRLNDRGRQNPTHRNRIAEAARAGRSERLGRGTMPDVITGLQALAAFLAQYRVK